MNPIAMHIFYNTNMYGKNPDFVYIYYESVVK